LAVTNNLQVIQWTMVMSANILLSLSTDNQIKKEVFINLNYIVTFTSSLPLNLKWC